MRRALAAFLAAAAVALLPAAPAVAQVPACEVGAATLTWGFKESFRAYIDGSIANGEWTVADGATYETPAFGFTSDGGRFDPRGPFGQVDFPGSVRFTGHGGVLDTTIANPALLFRGGEDDALLLLDVSGPTMEGDEVEVTATPFVTVDLSGQDLTPVDGVVTIDGAPTTLTGDGEAAFPNYPAGTEFDPISATFDVGDCDLTGQPIGGDASGDGQPRNLALVVTLFVIVSVTSVGGILALFLVRRARRRA
jgi:hypothetical protein